MKWAREDSEPITTDSFVTVVNAAGVHGCVKVFWVAGCVRLGTHVYIPARDWRVKRTLDAKAQIVDWKDLD